MIWCKRSVFGTKREMGFGFMVLVVMALLLCLSPVSVSGAKQGHPQHQQQQQNKKLRFGQNGEFKILQVADMHYANGKATHCLDVLPSQYASCSDLNTTAFLHRIILAEKPNLIVFTGMVFNACYVFSFGYHFFLIVAFLFFSSPFVIVLGVGSFSPHSFKWKGF